MSRAPHLRLLKLEQGTGPDEPTAIFPNRPMDEDEAAVLLRGWRALVAPGDARHTTSPLRYEQ